MTTDNPVVYRFRVAFAPELAGPYMRIEARGLKRHPAVLITEAERRRRM